MIRSSSSVFCERDRAVHDVLDHDRALVRIAEAHHRVRRPSRGRGAVPAAAVVARLLLARELRRAHRVELFLGAVAVIRLAFARGTARSLPRSDRSAASGRTGPRRDRARATPCRRGSPARLRPSSARGPCPRSRRMNWPPMPARVQPAEQRRAHAADVQQAGGARGESGTDAHGRFATGTRRHTGRRVNWWAVDETRIGDPIRVLATTRMSTDIWGSQARRVAARKAAAPAANVNDHDARKYGRHARRPSDSPAFRSR